MNTLTNNILICHMHLLEELYLIVLIIFSVHIIEIDIKK